MRVRTTDSFFFQAEDGIRDLYVTGVQTCALPICDTLSADVDVARRRRLEPRDHVERRGLAAPGGAHEDGELAVGDVEAHRSEERRVGKECRGRCGQEE